MEAFPTEPPRHRLKREIVSTVLTNAVINLAGPVFPLRMREVSGLSALKARIDGLDGKVDAGLQTRLYGEIADQFRRVTPWFLSRVPAEASIADTVLLYRAGVEALRPAIVLTGDDTRQIASLAAEMPEDLARDMTLLRRLAAAPEIARLAQDMPGANAAQVAEVYFTLGALLGLDRLRGLAGKLAPPDHWDRLALQRLWDDLSVAQGALAARLLAKGRTAQAWAEEQQDALGRTRAFLDALEASGELSVAKLMLASSQIQALG